MGQSAAEKTRGSPERISDWDRTRCCERLVRRESVFCAPPDADTDYSDDAEF